MDHFGDILREKRRAAKLSQRQLARIVGVDFSYISKLENSRVSAPSVGTITEIAKAVGCGVEDFLALARRLPREVTGSLTGQTAAVKFLNEASKFDLTREEWEHLTKELRALSPTSDAKKSGYEGEAKHFADSAPVEVGKSAFSSDGEGYSEDRGGGGSEDIPMKLQQGLAPDRLAGKSNEDEGKTQEARLDAEILSRNEWASLVEDLSLSPRQMEVIRGLLLGQSDKQIARALQISVATVRSHLCRLFARFGAMDRVEVIVYVFTYLRRKCRSSGCPHSR